MKNNIIPLIVLGIALIVLYNSYSPKTKTSGGLESYTLYGKTKDGFRLKYDVTLEYGLDEYTLNLIKHDFSKISLKYSSDSIVYFENDFINFMSEQRVSVIKINRYINY